MINTTYNTLLERVDNVEETSRDLIELYQENESDAISQFYVRNYGLINKIQSKYYSVNQDERDSIILEATYNAFQAYEVDGDSSLLSLFRLILNRKFTDRIRKQNTEKRELDNPDNVDSIDAMKEFADGETTVVYQDDVLDRPDDTRLQDIQESELLTDAEKRVLTIYVRDKAQCTQKDVADELGISKVAVSRTLKRLREKDSVDDIKDLLCLMQTK